MSEHAEVSPEKQFQDLVAGFKKATDEVKSFAEKANTEIKNLGDVTGETKSKADKALFEMGDLATRLKDIEQKMSRRSEDHRPLQTKSLGQAVVDDEQYKSFSVGGGSRGQKMTVEVKAITSATTSGVSSTTSLVPAMRLPGVVEIPLRPTSIRALLIPGRTDSGSIDYVKESRFINNAAFVAEGALKPESDWATEIVNLPVRTIAHFIMASRQILADAPQLQSTIDGRLRRGLEIAEDSALLLGSGAQGSLLGLMPQATAYVQPVGVSVTNPTAIDRLRLAMLQVTLSFYPPSAFVLNPVDWVNVEMTKDTQGDYIFADPQAVGTPRLWGLPVVQSLAMPPNNFLTGAFDLAAQIFDREDATVAISTEDIDNFRRNMVTILAEERLGLAVYRPAALVKGTFTPPAP